MAYMPHSRAEQRIHSGVLVHNAQEATAIFSGRHRECDLVAGVDSNRDFTKRFESTDIDWDTGGEAAAWVDPLVPSLGR